VVIKVLLATPPQTQEAVKTNVTEAENAKAKVAEIEPEVAQAQAKVAEAEAEIRDAKDEIRDAKAKVAEAEDEVRDAKAKVAEVEAKVAKAEAKVAEAEVEVRDAKAKVAKAEAKVAEAEVKFNQDPANENWINELKERREALKTANDTLKRKDEALQTANEILKCREEFFFNLRSKSSIGHSGICFLFIFPLLFKFSVGCITWIYQLSRICIAVNLLSHSSQQPRITYILIQESANQLIY